MMLLTNYFTLNVETILQYFMKKLKKELYFDVAFRFDLQFNCLFFMNDGQGRYIKKILRQESQMFSAVLYPTLC